MPLEATRIVQTIQHSESDRVLRHRLLVHLAMHHLRARYEGASRG